MPLKDAPLRAPVRARGTDYEVVVPHGETDYIQRVLLTTGAPYEQQMLDAMADLLAPGDRVLDIGANIGNHTLFLAAVCGCSVVAFEPNKALTEALRQSVEINGLTDLVEVRSIALGREPSQGSFAELLPENLGGQQVALDPGTGDFEVRPLDHEQLDGPVRLIKIDVEGMELDVLEGAAGTIDQHHPLLFVECADLTSFEAVTSWMHKHSYSYFGTYNATPTHAFQHVGEGLLDSDRVALRLARDAYDLREQMMQARVARQEAVLKYRSVTAEMKTLRARMAGDEELDPAVEVPLINARLGLERAQSEARKFRDQRDVYGEQLIALRGDYARVGRQVKQLTRTNEKLRERVAAAREQMKRAKERVHRVERQMEDLEGRRSIRALRRVETLRNRLLGREAPSRRPRALRSAARPAELKAKTPTPATPPVAPAKVAPRPQTVRFDSLRSQTDAERAGRAASAQASSARLRHTLKDGERLRVAAIVDDFTRRSLAFDCDLLDLTPSGWREELAGFDPHLLFVESAWRGKDGLWHNTVSTLPPELRDILAWGRDHGVPSVFWNKEDPVHFHSFVRAAAEFDHVFTTDVDLVPRYQAWLGHDRIGFLPFACQPRIHNPIETHPRKDALGFAGGYYQRYPERMRDLRAIIDGALTVMPVEIYDRMLGTTLEEYAFPQEYQSLIRGTLTPDQIDVAYKGYRFALNLNSVKGSQSMFARRAYELLACNTLTISNYARGLRIMLGDLIPMSDSESETARRLRELRDDEDTADKLRAMGLRKVLTEHTWQDRLDAILRQVASLPPRRAPRVVTTLSQVSRVEECASLLHTIESQQGVEVRAHVVTADEQSRTVLAAAGVTVHDAERVKHLRADNLMEPDSTGFALLRADDWYGPHHLLDLHLAWTYADAEVVGKASFAASTSNGLEPVDPDHEYQYVDLLSLRGALLSRTAAEAVDVIGLLQPDVPMTPAALTQFSIHRFGYVRGGAGVPESDELAASLPLDTGRSLESVQRAVEESVPVGNAFDHVPVLTPAGFKTGRPQVALNALDEGVRIVSQLPEGARDLIWHQGRLPVRELWPDGTARFGVTFHGDLDVMIALRFHDVQGDVITSITRVANANHELPVPPRAATVSVALRVVGPGRSIATVYLGPWPAEPNVSFFENRVLLLADHYPTYREIYRNGFVHARARSYREEGLEVDAFRLLHDGPRGHHEYEGLEVLSGPASTLRATLATGQHDTVLVHFLHPAMWAVLSEFADRLRIVVWVHGAEVQPWHRRTFNYKTEAELEAAKVASDIRLTFWRDVLDSHPRDLRLVFVSEYFAREVMEDLERPLSPDRYTVVHNPIDTKIFAYEPKTAEQRHKVLSVRSYASPKYANDLSVAAVLELAEEPWFDELEFRFIGDGPLFEETLAPLRDLPNVVIEQRFLTHEQMAALYRDYGVILVPTRMDAQGVSRDEAMSSGLVPVTSGVAAVPEFVSTDEGILAPLDDHHELAAGIARLHADPDAFLRMSQAAARRVREQSSAEKIIAQEIAVITADD